MKKSDLDTGAGVSENKEKGQRKMTDTDAKYMKEAIRQAKKAYAIGEVPIGCVIVRDGKIISRGYNRRTIDKNTLAHAELAAIKKASKKLDDWRLEGCTMYVTLEPCQMCAGALVQSRIDRVVVGCMNPKAGCAGSILNLLQMPEFNHQVELETGVLEEECSCLTAPGRFCLVLLRSRPDTVHRFPSRKTQSSTPLIKGSSERKMPSAQYHPYYSGL